MAEEKKIKVSDFTKVLTKEEKAFLKDTIRHSINCGCWPRYIRDTDNSLVLVDFSIYIPKSNDCHKMLKGIFDKTAEIGDTTIISYAFAYTGDVLLIRAKYANKFESWARR